MAGNLAAIRSRIERAGGDPDAIQIVAATKNRSAEECRAAVAAGLTLLGENRVQEALAKMDEVPGAGWHLIGHLQTNKVRQAGRFQLIQSLDSVRLARALAARGKTAVLLEVNVAREAQKTGVEPEAAISTAAEVAELLDLRGFMGMAPLGGDAQAAFAELRRLRDEAEQHLGRALPILSMGMSEDLEDAIRAGTTMVRIGRALFE
ncbi:MAG: YggS family pyridoxal phosphate-dependent enzyme [Candidatus Dormibacteraeota bacterium]|nr:YggS family pyridoxal phosphate-dependent enzyme [Candidatus Dormibacteraeota bacterium]